MNKVPPLFVLRFSEKGKCVGVGPEVTPGCEWVLAGEGVATRKWDGTACAVIGGKLHKRLDIKNLGEPPPGWIPCARIETSKSKPGWLPVGFGPEDQWHREAAESAGWLEDGTYELCGPKIGGNAEGLSTHRLILHGNQAYHNAPRGLDELKAYLARLDAEGVVFHHPDGRMAKIRRRDFGLPWPIKKAMAA